MHYCWFVRGQEHSALCQVSMASVRKADHKAVCHVVTDDPKVGVTGAQMIRFEPGLPMMVANLEAQLQMLGSYLGEQVVFLDTDVLFLKPFPRHYEEGLVVTWRKTVGGKITDIPGGVAEVMPYNFGVLSAVSGLRTIEAFIWMRERVRKMDPRLQVWWGNQIALASLCGPTPDSGEVTDVRRIPWLLPEPGMPVRVRKLPGSIWNYTPGDEAEDLTGRGAVHFKGHTRPWMKTVAERLALPWLEAA
jgi:hypothetical protein